MKVAIPWSTNEKNQYGDEYNIGFNQNMNDFDNLFNFISSHNDIRFNIKANDLTLKQMIALDEVSPHVYFIISNEDLELVKKMYENNLKYYFHVDFAPSSFFLLEEHIQLGVTDIYLSDELCYNLKKVKEICEKHNIEVRLVLNRICSHRIDKAINPRTPLFIPEYYDELSKYVDVGEFESNSWAKIDTYYKIWFQKKEWRENLRFIYPELKIDIPNESLIPNFLAYKMNCGYRCGQGSSCKKCEQFIQIAQVLRSKNIEYEKGE